MQMKCTAVVFDLFGTLVENLRRAEFERMLSQMARLVLVSEKGFVRLWNDTWDERSKGVFSSLEADIQHLCTLMNARPDAARISEAAELAKIFARQVLDKPRDTTLETLAFLKDSGLSTGLISNCAANVPSVWAETLFARLVDVPVFSCSVGLKKPDPEIYFLACRLLRVQPRNALYVADGNEHELTGASKAGLTPVLFRGPDEDPYDEGHDRKTWQGPKVTSLSEILHFLDN
jgi:putative hydrolase of the HAD superfamily